MKALFVIPGAAQAGSSMVFARRQADSLIEQGVAVEIFNLQSRTSLRILWNEFRRFRTVLASFRPQVVHAHFGTVTAAFAALAAGRHPLVITYRGSDLNAVPTAGGPRAVVGRLLSQLAALRAARIVCVSRRLQQRLWWRRERVTVLPTGVDFEIFKTEPREVARARLGWRREDRIVLFNASSDPRNKRLDLARSVLRQVERDRAGVRLEILDGQIPPELVPTMMSAADCLLVTSDEEGSPAVVQEALASNLPVVSVDVGDVGERLSGVARSRIVARDRAELARAVVELVEDGHRSDGRREAGQCCSRRIARELVRLYSEALVGRQP